MNPIKRFFTEDIPAVFSSGKWRFQLAQINLKLKQIESQKTTSLGELGKKAWTAKVKDEKYKALFEKLEENDELIGQAQQEIVDIQEKTTVESERLNSITAEYDSQLKILHAPHQSAIKELSQMQSGQKAIEQQISTLQKTINQNNDTIKNTQILIDQTQAANPPDKEAKIASLNNIIISVRAKTEESQIQLQHNVEKKAVNNAGQLQLHQKIDDYSRQIKELQNQKVLAQKPVQEKLSGLKQDLQKTNERKTGLLKKTAEMMPEFGAQVYKSRPITDILSKEYANVDTLQREIGFITDQRNLTMARLSSVNSKSVLRFVITIGSLVILILAVVFFFPSGPTTSEGESAGGQEKTPKQTENPDRGETSIIDELVNNQTIDKKIGVTPPSDGFFYVADNLTAIEVKPVKFHVTSTGVTSNFVFVNYDLEQDKFDGLPVFTDKKPVFLYKSGKIEFQEFQLYKGQPTFNVYLEEGSSPCTIELSGNSSFQENDKIFGLDNEQFSDCNGLKEVLSTKRPFTSVSVDLQRGTVRNIRSITPPTVSFQKVEKTKNQHQNGTYFAVYPLANISPSVYCFIRKENAPDIGYCFRME